jgi:hypothetical protein
MGLFLPKATWVPYVLFGVSALIVAVILIQSGDVFGSDIGYWFSSNWPLIVGLLFIIILVAVVIGASKADPNKPAEVPGPFFPWVVTPAGPAKTE